MSGTTALQSFGWGAVALVLGALSIVTMSGELRVPRQIGTSAEQSTERLFGLSHRSAAATMERCEEQIGRPATRLLPSPQWHAVLDTCAAQANFVVARWPTDARAWLLIATTSSALQKQTPFADALQRSQQFAPAVQWLAERRLALADKATDLGGYSYAADVRSLLDSDAGARVLAGNWVAGDAARRTRIETAAEAADPTLQQRLLDKIRERTASSPQP